MAFKLKAVMLSGAALSMLGTSAMAADFVPTPVNDWTGFYIGIGGGGSFAFSNTDATGYSGFLAGGEGFSEDWDFEFEDGGTVFGNGSLNCGEGPGFCAVGFANQVNIGSGSSSGQTPEVLNEIFTSLNNLTNGSGGDSDTGVAGAFGTIEGGFDYQIGSNFLIGLNGAFNLGSSSIENSASASGAGVLADFDLRSVEQIQGLDVALMAGAGQLETDLELGNSWSIGARAGYLVSDSILLFASGGYISTQAELKASYKAAALGVIADGGGGAGGAAELQASSSDDDWLNGYYLGAGVETLLTETISFKMEYRFADLGSIETSVDYAGEDDLGPAGAIAAAGVSAEADPIIHSIRATINWRF